MRTGRVDKIKSLDGGTITVHQKQGPSTGAIDMKAPAIGVLHTIEWKYILSGYPRGCPTLAIGKPGATTRSRLEQWIPFGNYATALQNDPGGVETNRRIRVQIELAGYSSLQPWLPADKEQTVQLASFMEWAKHNLDIPESRPFPDTLQSGVIWATEGNPRRRSGLFTRTPGWYGHVEIPENDHWDPGSLKTRVLLALDPEPDMVVRRALRATWEGKDHRTGTDIIKPTTLRGVGRAIARDPLVRKKIREHQRQGHRIVIAKRRIERED